MEQHEEEEEIIIETEMSPEEGDGECEEETHTQIYRNNSNEDEEDDSFHWDEPDPFEVYDPPAKKVKKSRKRKDDDDANSSVSKGKGGIQKYKVDWEKIPQFKKWLSVSLVGPEYFYCKDCKIDAKCGKSEIMRHMVSKKHAKNSQSTLPKKKIFEGLFCPVFTPIDRTRFEEINYNKISDYADYLRREGIKAVLINDVISEGMSMTVAERCLITEEWLKASERTKIYLMVQVGGAPLKEVIRMVRHAVSKKVNAIAVLPDLYNKPNDHYDLLRYIKSISDYADNMPIWYHHYPKYSNVHIDMKKFMTDVNEIDSFTGVIFNSTPLEEVVAAVNANPRLISIIATDCGILSAAAHGFKSILTPALNFLPKRVQNICKLTANDKISEARDEQKALNAVFDIIHEQGNMISSMKTAMNLISRVQMGPVRRPLVDVWKKQVEQMQNEFKTLGTII